MHTSFAKSVLVGFFFSNENSDAVEVIADVLFYGSKLQLLNLQYGETASIGI